MSRPLSLVNAPSFCDMCVDETESMRAGVLAMSTLRGGVADVVRASNCALSVTLKVTRLGKEHEFTLSGEDPYAPTVVAFMVRAAQTPPTNGAPVHLAVAKALAGHYTDEVLGEQRRLERQRAAKMAEYERTKERLALESDKLRALGEELGLPEATGAAGALFSGANATPVSRALALPPPSANPLLSARSDDAGLATLAAAGAGAIIASPLVGPGKANRSAAKPTIIKKPLLAIARGSGMKVTGDTVVWRGNRFSVTEFRRLVEAAGEDVVWRHIGKGLKLWAPGEPGVVNKSSSTCLKLLWNELQGGATGGEPAEEESDKDEGAGDAEMDDEGAEEESE